jgi:hypothetical protein
MTKEVDRHKAPKAERDIAAYWAGLYRKAQKSPDRTTRSEEGFNYAHDGNKFGKGFVVHADDTECLIALLENFAIRGTFRTRLEGGLSDILTVFRVSLESQALVKGGMSEAKAWREAKKLGGSETSFRRIRARIQGRLPSVIKNNLEKAERIKERRKNRLTPIDTAWGISHPKV